MYRQNYFKKNKYNAVRQTYNGYNYDSRFEARVAADLDLQVKGKQIKSYERQFKLEILAYDCNGKPIRLCNHKVDFCVTHLDGSFELLEAKGLETTAWRKVRKYIEQFWLPEHPDYTYTVTKESKYYLPMKR
ncbi:DUF1064 domain-containing protein [Polynucleobacter sp.]|uniref:DUF1064 domain-containing protein n=1 Tax=Polynucleobacter sp. TaxID=2029855 RepID=UPI003F699EC1